MATVISRRAMDCVRFSSIGDSKFIKYLKVDFKTYFSAHWCRGGGGSQGSFDSLDVVQSTYCTPFQPSSPIEPFLYSGYCLVTPPFFHPGSSPVIRLLSTYSLFDVITTLFLVATDATETCTKFNSYIRIVLLFI